MSDIEKYKLPPQQHENILEEIKKDCFFGKKPAKTPQAFILGGQPGAGKSVIIQKSINQLANDNIVVLNADEFRLLHPQAKQILDEHGKEFAHYTAPDVRDWGKEVFSAARQNRFNLIHEGTMRTDQICETIKQMQQEGYKIHIRVMAVPEIKSRVSIYSRYQELLDSGMPARFTSREDHDNAYYGMLKTLQKIEDEKLYDTIQVVNRKGDTLFNTGDKNICEAVETERKKPLTEADKTNLISDCDILLAKMKKRGEKDEYLQDLTNLRSQLAPTDRSKALAINQLRGLKQYSAARAPYKSAALSKIDSKTLQYVQSKNSPSH